ncbi:HGxxPAAW family protein [Kineococcus sp. SYSU DK018]|uniref:HGxxPAAW family protein n=1 Tax=Kineococcus sp. SYSU DK018 TaxID=3383139 RepID=UPI003D7D9B29
MTSQQPETTHGDVVQEHGHGHSVAAWAGVATALVGFLVLCLAVVFTSLVWGIVGGVIILASLVVGYALSKAGHGVKSASGHAVGVGRARH